MKKLQLKLSQREAQIQTYKAQAADLASVGPLKNHIEQLELSLSEKQGELVASQLQYDQLKQEHRNLQVEMQTLDSNFELQEKVLACQQEINQTQECKIQQLEAMH